MAITDTFTGTNGTGLVAYSALWAYLNGTTTAGQIQSNMLACAHGGGDQGAKRTETTFPNDHYSQVALGAVSNQAGEVMGPAVRGQAAASEQMYGITWGDAAGANYLFEQASGSWTQMGSTGSSTQDVADVIRLTATGTSIAPTINGSATGTPGAQTDATYTTGAPGLVWYNNFNTPSGLRLDSFECTDVTGGASTILRQMMMHHA
jgi:hypothetical protein